jgi:hypothetical protein
MGLRMNNIKVLVIMLLVLLPTHLLKARQVVDTSASNKEVKVFVSLYHQHHDFFGTAFSYQGVEGGIDIDNKYYLGLYGAIFASNLKAEINGENQSIWIGQGGVEAGYLFFNDRRIRPGVQLNMGFFGLQSETYRLNGMVFSPQFLGEFTIKRWFRIRTGVAYNFYDYRNHSAIKSSELNSFSFNFGLVFKF